MCQAIPKLTTVYLYLTNYCNLNCRHCWIDPSGLSKRESNCMELKLLIHILEQTKELGMRTLKITGGEPLLYDSFIKFLEWLKKKKWNLYLHMETNGTLIDDRMARILKECGMKFVAVSIDGDNPDTHDRLRGRVGCYEKAWQAVKEMVNVGIQVQIITAVYRGNVNQLENIAKKAEYIKAESIKANIVNCIGRAVNMAENGEILSLEEMLELNNRIEGIYRKRFKIRFCSSLPVAFRSLNRLLYERGCFCKIKELLGILATGKLSICGIGEEIDELIIGDGRLDSIKDIWQNSSLLSKIRKDIPSQLEGVCNICIFKNCCLGHCVADTYYSTGSLTSPFWICQSAFQRGLFPHTRLIRQK